MPVNDFYTPDVWRAQSEDNKQASAGEIENQSEAKKIFGNAMNEILGCYEKLLELGVAKEQARVILPLNQFTEVYWTASFQAVMNFLDLRDHTHAQWEIREYAKAIKEFMLELFPETTKIWFEVKNK